MAEDVTFNSLNEEWKNKKGTYNTDAEGTSSYWNDYAKAIADYGTSHSSDLDFDSTTYNLYKNYIDSNASAAKDTYDAQIRNNNMALNSKLEQGAIKDNAMKYANNMLASQGLANQGVSQSYQAGIGNNYATNLVNIDQSKTEANQSAWDTYQTALTENQNTLNTNLQTQAATDKSNAYEMATSMLNSATSDEDIQNIKSQYYNSMSPEMQSAFDFYANKASETINTPSASQSVATSQYASASDFIGAIDGLENLTVYGDGGATKSNKTVSKNISNEATALYNRIQNGEIPDGSVVRLQSKNYNANVYLKVLGGKVYAISNTEYNNSSANKVHITDK